MRISYDFLKPALVILILLTVTVFCAILYDTNFYHNFEFHPIPQHEPQTPAPEAH